MNTLPLPSSARPFARRSDPEAPLTFAIIGVYGYASILLDSLEPLITSGEATLTAATVRTRAKAAERCQNIEQRGGLIFQEWRAMVDAIGRIESVHAICLWPRKDDYFARNSWAGRLRVGDDWVLDSPVNNAMGHFINLPLFWLGDTDLESATVHRVRGSLYRSRTLESFDTAAIEMTTSGGIPLYFHGSHACETSFGPQIRILGSKGEIHWVGDTHYSLSSSKESITVPILSTRDARRQLFRNVAAWLLHKPAHVSTAEQALAHTRAVHLIHSGIDIQTVSPEHLDIKEGMRILKNLEARFKAAFAEARLLASTDAAWVVADQSVDWQDVRQWSYPPHSCL